MITPKQRQSIYERDGHRCCACGKADSLTIQHRVSKGMGGSKEYDLPAYLITMCLTCNVGLEADYKQAELGRFNGWKLSRNARPPVNPEEVPVKIGREWFLLDNNGGKTPMTRR